MAGQNTVLGDAIGLAIRSFEASSVEARILILLSDGTDTGSRMAPAKAADIAAKNGVVIHTIAVGDPDAGADADRVDIPTLQAIASATGGSFNRAEDADRPRRHLRPDRRRRRAAGRRPPPGARAPRSPPSPPPPSPLSSSSPTSSSSSRTPSSPAIPSRGPGMTALAAFTFLRPLVLLGAAAARRALAPPPPPAHRRGAAGSAHRAAPARRAHHRPQRRSRVHAPDLLIGAAMLMTLAAAGPPGAPAPSPFVTETAPLVIALDLSPSMSGTDVAPSRLERAKQKIRDLIALRAGGRVGLVAYAGTAHLVMPLTDDPTVLLPFLEALDPAIMPDAGRTASAALALAESAARPRGRRRLDPLRHRWHRPRRHRRLPGRRQRPRRPDRRARHRRRDRRLVPPRRRRHRPGQHRRRRRPRRRAGARLQPRPRRRRRGPPPGRRLAARAPCRAPRAALVPPRHHPALGRDAARAGAAPAGHVRAAGLAETLAGWFWTPDQQGAASTPRTATPRPPRPSPTPNGAPPPSSAPASTPRRPRPSPRSRPRSPRRTAAPPSSAAATTRARIAAFEAALKLDPATPPPRTTSTSPSASSPT